MIKIKKTDFTSDGLIEGWTSMIWTERHKELGDFQMKTPYVAETMAKIPMGSLISLRDTNEVCMVQTHSIQRDSKGAPELLVQGQSLEWFLDQRVLTGPYREPWYAPGTYTVQNALCMFIWNSIVNPTAEEVIRDYHWDHLARDVIPNVVVSDSTIIQKPVVGAGSTGDLQTPQEWMFNTGSLYPKVQDMLQLGGLGIRIVRPNSTGSYGSHPTGAKILSNVTYPAGNYVATRTLTKSPFTSTNKLRFDIYNGRDRSKDSATNAPLDPHDPVTFSYIAGDVDDPSYLLSIKDYKSLVHLQSPFAKSVEIQTGLTGLDLFAYWAETPPMDDSLSGVNLDQALTDLGFAEYYRRKPLRAIDGAVSSHNQWIYGLDYYLGDIVQVAGEYGTSGRKMVSEYIRSADSKGEKAYPTLVDP